MGVARFLTFEGPLPHFNRPNLSPDSARFLTLTSPISHFKRNKVSSTPHFGATNLRI